MRLKAHGLLAVTAAFALLELSCAASSGRPLGRALGRPLEEGRTYDEPPVPVTAVEPIYPESAREANITGTVVLHVLVATNGRVEDMKLVQGMAGLDRAATDAARRWVFKPALRDDKPVAAWYEISFEFPE